MVTGADWRHAFINLYAALPSDKKATDPLKVMTNPAGNKLYHTEAGLGKLLQLKEKLFPCLSRSSKSNEKSLENFVVQTHISFRKEVPIVYSKCIALLNSIQAIGNGRPCGVEVGVPRLEAFISHWIAQTHPFLKVVHKRKNASLENFLLQGTKPRSFNQADKKGFSSWLKNHCSLFIALLRWFKSFFIKVQAPHLPSLLKQQPLIPSILRQEIAKRKELAVVYEEDRARQFYPFMCPILFAITQQLHNYLEIKRRIDSPIPLEAIFRLFQNKNIESSHDQALKQFIRKIDSLKPCLSPQCLHALLQLLENQIPEPNSGHSPNKSVAEVEIELMNRGCKLLHADDPKQIRWRKKLAAGSIVETEEDKYEILDEVGPKQGETRNRTRVFRLKNDPTKVLITGQNQAILAIEERLRRNCSLGIGRPELYYLDPEGRFALMKYFPDKVSEHQWETKEGEITEEEKDYLAPLLNLIKFFIEKKDVPQRFNKEHLYFSEDGVLNYVKLSPASKDFNFSALEDLCQIGSPAIYKYLMKESGLYKHPPYAGYFKFIIRRGLESGEVNCGDEAGVYKIDDPRVVELAENLVKNSRDLQIKILNKLKKRIQANPLDEDKLLLEISQAIIARHTELNSVSCLWAGMKDEIVEQIAAQYMPKITKVRSNTH